MVREKSLKTTLTLERETIKTLDGIAESFEDYVSRGELIDLIVTWAMDSGFEGFLDKTFEESRDEGESDEEVRGEPNS